MKKFLLMILLLITSVTTFGCSKNTTSTIALKEYRNTYTSYMDTIINVSIFLEDEKEPDEIIDYIYIVSN